MEVSRVTRPPALASGAQRDQSGSEHINRTVLLWLLVIFVGIQFGAGWYEKLAVVPLWADASADQQDKLMESRIKSICRGC